jgi:EH domain-containing protein 1
MEKEKASEVLAREIEQVLQKKMRPIFERYGLDIKDLLVPLKWRPIVLIIGNYSSGKSTFINEVLGSQVQRTGQSPTDDSFTIISAPEDSEPVGEIPGPTLVNDEHLPFVSLRHFGESLLSHMRLKKIDNSSMLQDLAIIDTPGMLDSVTEKDRGYDYLGVVGELARLADLIILMFDPHKAGTIKETYQAIRGTLPGSTGEDRVLYVLNRIDECENMTDLLRSYGTLCWNLSQMTGRKDMPRIYLTFAPQDGKVPQGFEVWMDEREELKQAMRSAPKMRLNHMLQEVDRVVRELEIEIEALAAFRRGFVQRLKGVVRTWGLVALLAFFFGDLVMKLLFGYPDTPFVEALLTGRLDLNGLLWPTVWTCLVLASASLYVQRMLFPRFVKNTLKNLDSLIPLETAYKRDLWGRVRDRIHGIITDQARKQIWIAHGRYLGKIRGFLKKDLSRLYGRI